MKKRKKEYNRQLREGRDYFFCDLSCAAKHRNQKQTKAKEEQARKNPIEWNSDIAYLTGLITSDGTLQRDKPRIAFTNSEFELIEHVRDIVEAEINGQTYKPQKHSRDGSVWWRYQFTSRRFYYFLQAVGLTPNKSLTISELEVPDEYFFDFLRGEIDGDGGFTESGTKFRCRMCSGSKSFLDWVITKIKKFIDIKSGWLKDGDNVYRLEFSAKDSVKIAKAIYQDDKPKLTRKYKIVEKYIE